MSGDGGLDTTLEGVARALRQAALDVELIGPGGAIRHGLEAKGLREGDAVRVVDCDDVLPAGAGPAQALRRGRGSTMQVALERVANDHAAAVVSAGSTGALMALSRQVLGMLPGVERPALMAALPTRGDPVWVLDLGANVGVDAHRLCEFGQMGSATVRVLRKIDPRVGLLNIGQEPSKGPDVVREAARLLDRAPGVDFHGFVEADRVFAGDVDLVVCDGFAGNVLLKGAEGMARLLFAEFTDTLGPWRRRLVGGPLRRLYDKLDPSRHNGAPLLGVRGIVIKSHGSACSRGFASAIELAALEARRNLVPELEDALWASY
jgi:glycerol-3-phosphate acyltransferase PlsX